MKNTIFELSTFPLQRWCLIWWKTSLNNKIGHILKKSVPPCSSSQQWCLEPLYWNSWKSGHIYKNKTMFPFFKGFFITKKPPNKCNWPNSPKNIFKTPPENTLYFQEFFADSSKSINFSKKVIDDIIILCEIPLLLVYQWSL